MAIPLDAVRQSLAARRRATSRAPRAGASILYEQHAVPFIPLAAALDSSRWSVGRGGPRSSSPDPGASARSASSACSGTARIVVRPLPAHLKSSPLVVGAALDAEGNPQLVLDPDGLVAAAHGARRRRASTPAPPRRPVLVIDDSLTTRMLEQSILESAGLRSRRGELRRGRPRDGPAQALRAVPRRRRNAGHGRLHLRRAASRRPGAPRHPRDPRHARARRRKTASAARAAGAHGYIVKSEFDQAELLAHDPADGGLTVVSNTIRVLVVEDSLTVRKRLSEVLAATRTSRSSARPATAGAPSSSACRRGPT